MISRGKNGFVSPESSCSHALESTGISLISSGPLSLRILRCFVFILVLCALAGDVIAYCECACSTPKILSLKQIEQRELCSCMRRCCKCCCGGLLLLCLCLCRWPPCCIASRYLVPRHAVYCISMPLSVQFHNPWVRVSEMTVNKMLHDGLVRDTQLNQPPSKSMIKRIHAWSAEGGLN